MEGLGLILSHEVVRLRDREGYVCEALWYVLETDISLEIGPRTDYTTLGEAQF